MKRFRILFATTLLSGTCLSATAKSKVLNVLFIGNSYTARHNLVKVVKELAEAGNPGLAFNATSVIYGGRRLVDHWRLGSQHVVNLHALKREDVEATIASLEAGLKKDPKDSYAKSALTKNRELLKETGKAHSKWDVIVLQSYRDDLEGDKSLYAQYAPRFADFLTALKENGQWDDTIVLFMGGFSNPGAHSRQYLPSVLAGGGLRHQGLLECKLGGRLEHTLSELYVSICHQMGVDVGEFAAAKGDLDKLIA